ncbi:HNH endonuclease signature motif containing protein [Klebsiella pneumoniae]|uniref:HNH nuclease domain-containing protein n=2 Tax=Klebsiella pneumoniae TaxID=573 RepID=A0AAX2BBS4_KLEPN|nr:HNH endonuclease signature motif containing protein [Klebsiella pneumoniae]SAU01801.1 Uncharacterised protein [Klebsiella pneumoniae]HBQ3129299.1 HNH endonuclease [Klebsiella pneumoniae]HBR1197618.1 HNH endonuclease [Klebsiella pneumoniae]HBR2170787.1 HNH endonuclease [Klebsiella pneumoniae]HBR2839375.1 HNH endonuclease [Klebsiella pneumoniae]
MQNPLLEQIAEAKLQGQHLITAKGRAQIFKRREYLIAWCHQHDVSGDNFPEPINAMWAREKCQTTYYWSKLGKHQLPEGAGFFLDAQRGEVFIAVINLSSLKNARIYRADIPVWHPRIAPTAPAAELVEQRPVPPTVPINPEVLAARRARAKELRALRNVQTRPGQGSYSARVIYNFGACCISGSTDTLEAAHIISVADGGSMSATNGLAMTKFLHTAFDQYVFSIDPETLTVVVDKPWRDILNIHGKQIAEPKHWQIDRACVLYHWTQFNLSKGVSV